MNHENGNTDLSGLERMILALAESEAHLKDQFARLAEAVEVSQPAEAVQS